MDWRNVHSFRALTAGWEMALWEEGSVLTPAVWKRVCSHSLPMMGSQKKTTDSHCWISLFLVSNKADMCVFIACLCLNYLFMLFTQTFLTTMCTLFLIHIDALHNREVNTLLYVLPCDAGFFIWLSFLYVWVNSKLFNFYSIKYSSVL